jgi:hypothetical protein
MLIAVFYEATLEPQLAAQIQGSLMERPPAPASSQGPQLHPAPGMTTQTFSAALEGFSLSSFVTLARPTAQRWP